MWDRVRYCRVSSHSEGVAKGLAVGRPMAPRRVKGLPQAHYRVAMQRVNTLSSLSAVHIFKPYSIALLTMLHVVSSAGLEITVQYIESTTIFDQLPADKLNRTTQRRLLRSHSLYFHSLPSVFSFGIVLVVTRCETLAEKNSWTFCTWRAASSVNIGQRTDNYIPHPDARS